jgi:hypothetical protein
MKVVVGSGGGGGNMTCSIPFLEEAVATEVPGALAKEKLSTILSKSLLKIFIMARWSNLPSLVKS